MNIELEKSEIVSWVQKLKDIDLIQKIKLLKKEFEKSHPGDPSFNPSIRKFGSGRHLVTYVADDFNEPIDDFKEYME
jgi:hypothetical protein